jgi:hypothetical protein
MAKPARRATTPPSGSAGSISPSSSPTIRAPQLPLWALGVGGCPQWLRTPAYAPRKRRRGTGTKPALFALVAVE